MPRTTQRMRYELMHLWMWTQGLKYLNLGITESEIIETKNSAISKNLLNAQTKVYDLLLDSLEKSLMRSPQPSILEIGAGISPGHERAAKLSNWNYKTLDASWIAVLRALIAGHKSRYGLISELPVPSQSLDAVCALECLCVVDFKEREAFLLELARVLKPKGCFISIDFHPRPFGEARLWLQKLMNQSGFQLEWIEDLSDGARQSIMQTEPERNTIFESIPSLVRNTKFGRALHESLNLQESEKYQKWLAGERAYFIHAWGLNTI